MNTHLLNLLEEYKNKKRISFSMPGHKNGKGILERLKENFFDFDVTELADTDNLHEPGKAISKTLSDIAKFYGADYSFVLLGGSTSGIFTMLMSTCKRGDKVVVTRKCHVSVINAIITLGLVPIFTNHLMLEELNILNSAEAEEIEKILKKEKVSAILITSPDYYGIVANVEAISKLAKSYNVPLLVDEAHGAHFCASESFPKSALDMGADMCVQSAHKTLNSANQTAFLHVKSDKLDKNMVKKAYDIFQTTSPSYPLLASAELAVYEIYQNQGKEWEEVIKNCNNLRNELDKIVKFLDKKLSKKYRFYDIDESRLVLFVSEYDATGFEIANKLRLDYNIDIELAELDKLVLIPTPANTKEDFENLKNALLEIFSKLSFKKERLFLPKLPDVNLVMHPDEAFYSEGIFCNINEAEGYISKNAIVPYPPGVPVVVPGEKITGEAVCYLSALIEKDAEVHGIVEKKAEVVKEKEF